MKNLFLNLNLNLGWLYLTAWDYILPSTRGKGMFANFTFNLFSRFFAKQRRHSIKKPSNLEEETA